MPSNFDNLLKFIENNKRFPNQKEPTYHILAKVKKGFFKPRLPDLHATMEKYDLPSYHKGDKDNIPPGLMNLLSFYELNKRLPSYYEEGGVALSKLRQGLKYQKHMDLVNSILPPNWKDCHLGMPKAIINLIEFIEEHERLPAYDEKPYTTLKNARKDLYKEYHKDLDKAFPGWRNPTKRETVADDSFIKTNQKMGIWLKDQRAALAKQISKITKTITLSDGRSWTGPVKACPVARMDITYGAKVERGGAVGYSSRNGQIGTRW